MTWRIVGVMGTRERPVARQLSAIAEVMRGRRNSSIVVSQAKQNPIIGVVVSKAGKPLVDIYRAPNGSLVVVDGEIFNTREIAELAGGSESQFVDQPAALIFALVARRGLSALKGVEAAASILHWDANRGELSLMRDRLGHVPAYYAEHEGYLYFSNDLTALLALGVNRRLDLRALDSFFARGSIPSPWTPFDAIKKIPASHVVTVKAGRAPVVTRYALPEMRSSGPLSSRPEDRLDDFGRLFTRAVERRLAKTRSTGVLLSGGALTATVLATVARTLGAPAEALTFQYGHANGTLGRARAAARHFGVRHGVMSCSPHEVATHLEQVTCAYGEPVTTDVTSYLLSETRRSGVDVILDASGSWSTDVPVHPQYMVHFGRIPAGIRSAALAAHRLLDRVELPLPRDVQSALWAAHVGLPVTFAPSQMNDFERCALYAGPARMAAFDGEVVEQLKQIALDYGGYSPTDELRLLSRHLIDAENSFSKNTSWARSCDVLLRSPYCDSDLQDFLMRSSPEGNGSALMRDYSARLLPPELVGAYEAPRALPVSRWLKGPLVDFMHDHATSLKTDGLFQPERINLMVDQHLRGSRDYGAQLWALIAFSVWQRSVLRVPHAAEGDVANVTLEVAK